MINFLNMRYFIAVAEARSFSGAAKNLYVSQQTLSIHISQIEAAVGTPLFERTRPLTLTPAGERFLRGARELLFINQQMERELKDMVDPFSNPLRIGISHAYARALLPRLLEPFCQEYPNVSVQINELNYDQMNEQLSVGKVDMILTRPTYCGGETEVIPLLNYDDLYLYAPESTLQRFYGNSTGKIMGQLGKNARLSTVADCPFILPRAGNVRRGVTQMFVESKITPQIRSETDTLETAIYLCRNGLGITLAPSILLFAYAGEQEHSISESAYLVSRQRPEYALAICYLKSTHLSRVMSDFIAITKRTF